MPPAWQAVPACAHNGHSEGGPFFFATTTMRCGRPFFFAATKIRIGRGRSLPLRPQQVKPFFFAATKIRIGRETTPPQRPQQAKLFFIATTKIRIRRGALWWQGRLQQAKPFSPASILKSGPEIKNRCTQQGINRQNLASIP